MSINNQPTNPPQKIPFWRTRWFWGVKILTTLFLSFIIALISSVVLLYYKKINLPDIFLLYLTLFFGNLGLLWWFKLKKILFIYIFSLIISIIVVIIFIPLKQYISSYIFFISQMCDANITFPIDYIIISCMPVIILIFLWKLKNKIINKLSKIINYILQYILGFITIIITFVIIYILNIIIHFFTKASWCGT